jgi:hypothetical protein
VLRIERPLWPGSITITGAAAAGSPDDGDGRPDCDGVAARAGVVGVAAGELRAARLGWTDGVPPAARAVELGGEAA